jgi:hypothetical protein
VIRATGAATAEQVERGGGCNVIQVRRSQLFQDLASFACLPEANAHVLQHFVQIRPDQTAARADAAHDRAEASDQRLDRRRHVVEPGSGHAANVRLLRPRRQLVVAHERGVRARRGHRVDQFPH